MDESHVHDGGGHHWGGRASHRGGCAKSIVMWPRVYREGGQGTHQGLSEWLQVCFLKTEKGWGRAKRGHLSLSAGVPPVASDSLPLAHKGQDGKCRSLVVPTKLLSQQGS